MNGYEGLGRFIVGVISYMLVTALAGFVLMFFAGILVDPLAAFPYCMWIAGAFIFGLMDCAEGVEHD